MHTHSGSIRDPDRIQFRVHCWILPVPSHFPSMTFIHYQFQVLIRPFPNPCWIIVWHRSDPYLDSNKHRRRCGNIPDPFRILSEFLFGPISNYVGSLRIHRGSLFGIIRFPFRIPCGLIPYLAWIRSAIGTCCEIHSESIWVRPDPCLDPGLLGSVRVLVWIRRKTFPQPV